jgi:L-iditol 2-dehydrogenase
LGIHLDGGFAEYVRIPEAAVRQGNIARLAPGVGFTEAALNEPLSCVYNGFLQCKFKPGDTVLIFGAGPVGIMHAKLAIMAGAAKVILTDLVEERLALSRQVENKVITVNNRGLKEEIEKLTNGQGVDVCITACSSPQAQIEAIELTATGGRVNFFGGLPAGKELVPLNTNLIHYKQLVLTGSTRSSIISFRRTLKFIAEDLVDIKGLVSNQYPLTRIKEAFQAAEQGRGLKNVIVFEN